MFMPERYNTQLRSQNANNIKFRRDIESHSKILGKPFRNIISIKIKENEMIGELKRCIKAEKDYFETVGATTLNI
ncbi:unnamed protein product [Rhizophagus irregularis]|nr:unnamed protein product [Rhizophagus irregularis]